MQHADSLTESIEPNDERAEYVAGLRELASFVESHPELPVPMYSNHNTFVRSKDALATVARSGVRWEKEANGDYFSLVVRFAGGHTYEVNIERSQVCRKVVTGTRIEPAKPEHEVEEFHWICDEPLLSGGAQ